MRSQCRFVRALLFWVLAASPPVQGATLLEGQVVEKGTKNSLANAAVFLLPPKLRTETDAQRRFRFSDVEAGTYEIVVTLADFERVSRPFEIGSDASNAREAFTLPRIFLERVAGNDFEFTVVGQRDNRRESTTSLGRETFLTVPGASGDPVKAVQNLPGVNRSSGFSSQVQIQGSEREDTRYRVDGHEVPLVFHFGGLSSVVFPEAVERVDLSTAGYGAEQGRALGGVVGLWTREPRSDRTRGVVFADTLNAGALVEGPVAGNGGYLVSLRQSYVGWILKKVTEGNDRFSLSAVPQYRDLTGLYAVPLTDRWTFRLSSVYSQDNLSFLFKEPLENDPNFRGSLDNETRFYRVLPGFSYRLTARDDLSASVGFGSDSIRVQAGENSFRIDSGVLSTVGEWKRDWGSGEELTTRLGWDNTYARTDFDILLPNTYSSGGVSNPVATGQEQRAVGSSKANQIGSYWRADWRPGGGRWTLSPNLRLDYFSLSDEWLASPRPSLQFRVDEGLTLTASGGLYVQPPRPQDVAETFGNPDVKSARATHARVGFKKKFNPGSTLGWQVGGDVFWKGIRDIIVKSTSLIERDGETVPENVKNGAEGRVWGTQWDGRYTGEEWSGTLSYTLAQSRRRETTSAAWTPSAADQTHVLTLIASYKPNRRWQFSTRLRWVTGNLTTPVLGSVFDADNDVFIPVRGDYYSERLANFFQLDVRVDRRWTFETWILSAYLDVQNVTNRANVESTSYSLDWSQKREATGLPIYPVIGLKGEF